MFTDGTIAVSFLLVNCLLDDVREGRADKLTRLIERSADSQDDSDSLNTSTDSIPSRKSMVDVTFQMKDNAMFADVRVCSFTVVLSVEFLMKISDFFTVQNQDGGSELSEKQSKMNSRGRVGAASTTSNQIRMAKSSVAGVKQHETKEMQITVNLKIEKPDIILVEHMDNVDTNAMILNVSLIF